MLCTALAACGAPGSEQPDAAGPAVLRMGYPEGTVAADDAGFRATIDLFTIEPLVAQEPDGRLSPRLAEGWTWEADDLRLRLRLREGVTFHDGTPLSAATVAAIVGDIAASPLGRLYPSLGDVTAVRAEGELDVVFDLSRKSALLPSNLTFPLRGPGDFVGTGPFRLVEYTPLRATLERFDAYRQGAPAIDRVEIEVFESLRPAWASLLRGELDMVYDVPPEAVAFLQSDDIRVLRYARPYQYLIAFNSAREPLRTATVRRALNLAVDRDGLVRDVLHGNGQPSTGPIRPQFWAYDASVASYGHDPARAIGTLAAAGLEPGAARESENPAARLRFTCLVPAGFSVLEAIALRVQRDLYDVGVDMQIATVPVDDYNVRLRDGEFEAALLDMASGPVATRAYEMFWRQPDASGGFNIFGYDSDEAQRVVDALRDTPDNDAAVRTSTRRLQDIFLEDPPALFLAWNERARAVRQTFEVVTEPGRDPIGEIWRWRPAAP